MLQSSSSELGGWLLGYSPWLTLRLLLSWIHLARRSGVERITLNLALGLGLPPRKDETDRTCLEPGRVPSVQREQPSQSHREAGTRGRALASCLSPARASGVERGRGGKSRLEREAEVRASWVGMGRFLRRFPGSRGRELRRGPGAGVARPRGGEYWASPAAFDLGRVGKLWTGGQKAQRSSSDRLPIPLPPLTLWLGAPHFSLNFLIYKIEYVFFFIFFFFV
ncbi:uncharacterized protein [Pseudorca crassidens]|uniref:uncharacterized protein isoform X2 n=1 Tax=Pseudorca crassidens TaxID=82174 RepID=UPI00352C27A3